MTSPKLCVVCDKEPARYRRKTCANAKCLQEIMSGNRSGVRQGAIFTISHRVKAPKGEAESWWVCPAEEFAARAAEAAKRMSSITTNYDKPRAVIA